MKGKITENQKLTKIISVGNAGGNIIDYLHQQQQIKAHFIACDTEEEDLKKRAVSDKLLLEDDNVKELFQADEKAVILVAGLGGTTTRDYVPKIAQYCKNQQIPLYAVVGTPLAFEGENVSKKAEGTITELKKYTENVFIIPLEKAKQEYGKLDLLSAFRKVNEEYQQKIKEILDNLLLLQKN